MRMRILQKVLWLWLSLCVCVLEIQTEKSPRVFGVCSFAVFTLSGCAYVFDSLSLAVFVQVCCVCASEQRGLSLAGLLESNLAQPSRPVTSDDPSMHLHTLKGSLMLAHICLIK